MMAARIEKCVTSAVSVCATASCVVGNSIQVPFSTTANLNWSGVTDGGMSESS